MLQIRDQHNLELERTVTQLNKEHEVALCRLREETNTAIEVKTQRIASLESHIPDRDAAVQFEPCQNPLVERAMQTTPPPVCKRHSVALQVSLHDSRQSIGLQTSCSNVPDSPNLGSPILPIHSGQSTTGCSPFLPKAPVPQISIGTEQTLTIADSTAHSTSPVQSNRPARKLRLRRNAKRNPNSTKTARNHLPKLPSPVSGYFVSESESDSNRTPRSRSKENHRPTDDDDEEEEDRDTDPDGEMDQTKSNVLPSLRRGTRKAQSVANDSTFAAAGRRTRSTSRKNSSGDGRTEKVTKQAARERKTHSAVVTGTRRLPPLAESTQLMPDSFFQDELDHAVDQVYADFQRREDYPAFKQPATRHQLRRRR
ncbi:unnamed protein product [Echinostoma caproni]|uniref:Uncharacterized protein n=1 Tax=Echinostoma caproni TaxID=27848 RepID=A0A3P8JPK2_9TREM|nr:unnamed protein product [Echinostoma caproni]